MSTTTIRIEDDLKARVATAAQHAGKTAHAFMLDAISQTVEQVELDNAFNTLADQRWANLQARRFFERPVEQEQQPDMADLLQSGHRFARIEGGQQLKDSACGRGQLWLAGDGEFLAKAGAYMADRGNLMHQPTRSSVGRS